MQEMVIVVRRRTYGFEWHLEEWDAGGDNARCERWVVPRAGLQRCLMEVLRGTLDEYNAEQPAAHVAFSDQPPLFD